MRRVDHSTLNRSSVGQRCQERGTATWNGGGHPRPSRWTTCSSQFGCDRVPNAELWNEHLIHKRTDRRALVGLVVPCCEWKLRRSGSSNHKSEVQIRLSHSCHLGTPNATEMYRSCTGTLRHKVNLQIFTFRKAYIHQEETPDVVLNLKVQVIACFKSKRRRRKRCKPKSGRDPGNAPDTCSPKAWHPWNSLALAPPKRGRSGRTPTLVLASPDLHIVDLIHIQPNAIGSQLLLVHLYLLSPLFYKLSTSTVSMTRRQ